MLHLPVAVFHLPQIPIRKEGRLAVASGRSLSSAASSGARFTMLGQVARILIQTLSVVVLSRLLDASSFGLMAMVLAIVGVGELFRDFGLTQAAVQAKTLSHQQQSNLFWLNTAIGTGLACLAALSSWFIAGLYGDDRLVLLTQVISVTFLFNGLATQYRAQMMRELRFLALSSNEVLGQLAGFIAGAIVALATGSYWALAVQQIVTALVSLILLVVSTRWRPTRYRRGHQTRAFLGFGSFLVLAQIVTYASRNVDSVIIGIRLGATDLGFYNRAFQVLLAPLNQINAPATRVALPVLSRLQDDRERFDRYVIAAQSMLLQPIIAGFSAAAALAAFVVPIALGPGWEPTIGLFQILALGGCFQAASNACYWIFLARGKTRSQLWWALTARPLVIATVIVGSAWGVAGVAWGFTIGTIAVWPLGVWWVAKYAAAPGWELLNNGLRAIGVYGAAGLLCWLVYTNTETYVPGILAASAGLVVFLVVVLVTAVLWPRFRQDLLLLMHFARRSRRNGTTK